jgi:hypothetical protein
MSGRDSDLPFVLEMILILGFEREIDGFLSLLSGFHFWDKINILMHKYTYIPSV